MEQAQQQSTQAFQFTPLREGRPYNSRDHAILSSISIHAPPRGATRLNSSKSTPLTDFNSRPSARGDQPRFEKQATFSISIHAPPRGATKWKILCSIPSPISIHAPPRGATFNRLGVFLGRHISIHAPPRGATKSVKWFAPRTAYFNSRPSARGDYFAVQFLRAQSLFQFTPLREGRRQGTRGTVARLTFQFTPLREGRLALQGLLALALYFNSRPSARGDG